MTQEKRVLMIIEDEPVTQKTFSEVATRLGWDVAVFETGDAALQKLDQVRPTAILLDLMLPGISGFEVLKLLRNTRHFRGQIIIVSNLSSSPDVQKGMALGADDYLVKPELSMEELRKKLNRLSHG